jgi:hypothetical protein
VASNDGGSSDRLLERKLFGTTPSLELFNTKTLSSRQLAIITMVMNVNPLMVVIPTDVLCIQLPKYHDNDDPVIHIQQLTKVCVINGKDIDDHKLQYFPIFLRGRTTNWFAKYETVHPMATRNKYNGLSSIDLVKFIMKDKRLQL